MASLAVLTLKEAIIPIVPSFQTEDLRTTKVENKWVSAGNEQYAKMYLPVCSDPSQKELFLYVINQFMDAAHGDRLHLTTGNTRYMKFRSVLDGDLRLTWQELADGRNNKTIETFNEDLISLISTYFHPSSYEDQLEYMRTTTKPFSMSCAALGSRLRVISQLCKYLPGSLQNDVLRPLYVDENSLKRAFFLLMPSSWRVKFAESGHVLDGEYNYQNLVRFMSVQEMISKRGATTPQSGGKRRAPGRGGRSGHYGGRGRGRMNNGNYRPPYQGSYSSFHQGRGMASPSGYAQVPPYGNRTPAGRFIGRGGHSSGRSSGRSSYSGGRGTPSTGRGSYQGSRPIYMTPGTNPPYMPNLYTEHYMHYGHPPPHDFYTIEHHYGNQGHEEQYHADDQYYQHEHDQYYHGDETNNGTAGNEEHYHAEEEEKQSAEDAHWLDDLGF